MNLKIIKIPDIYKFCLFNGDKIIFVSDKLGLIMRLKDSLTK